jgi:hypothetical protein
MTDNRYLEKVLEKQDLDENGPELKELRKTREEVEGHLRDGFPDSDPNIKYGGSVAKKTLLKEGYDEDILNYFAHDDNAAGETLKDVYDNVARVLEKHYVVERKRSALRLLRAGDKKGLNVDVVPGRYTDAKQGDAYLHVNEPDKERVKTNPDKHIGHVRDSGRRGEVRLAKVWRLREKLDQPPNKVVTFVLELLVIDLLKGKPKDELADNFRHVLEQFRDHSDDLKVEDPANPKGNDLSDLLTAGVRDALRDTAKRTIEAVDRDGWTAVFGPVEDDEDEKDKAARAAAVVRMAQARPSPARPWCRE